MSSQTRIRSLPFGKIGGITSYPFAPSNQPVDQRASVVGVQKTIDENHFWYSTSRFYKKRGHLLDLGGDFYTTKDFYANDHGVTVSDSEATLFGKPLYRWTGQLAPTYADFSLTRLAAAPSSNQNLDAWGSNAIAKVIPTKSRADAAVSLAELLREGIPSMVGSALMKSKLRDIRKLGDEYLNYTFGWVPLVDGIKDIVKAYEGAEKTLQQLKRDSGRVVRRRLIEPSVVTEVHSTLASTWPIGGVNSYHSRGGPYKVTRKIRTERKRWFSGAFTYHLAVDEDAFTGFLKTAQEAKILYGVKLDPEVLWNLTPWSWAADWFANGGTLASNLSSFSQDGLVMRYGYVMETTTVTYTDTMHAVDIIGGYKGDLQHSYGTTVKVRRRATPFGFGLTWDGFSDYQMAIIAALGISRIPRGSRR